MHIYIVCLFSENTNKKIGVSIVRSAVMYEHMFFCNNTIDDARRQKRIAKNIKKANMIKSQIVLFEGSSIILWTLCQGKMFFS
jgi:hypothetical protein